MNFIFLSVGRWRSQHVVVHGLDNIMENMKSSNMQHGRAFVTKDVLHKLLAAFHATDCTCADLRLHIDTRGISADRKEDNVGYGDMLQVLQLLDKRHNTYIKRDAVPTVRAEPRSWMAAKTFSVHGHYRDRSERLLNKKKKNEVDLAELKRYEHETMMEQLRAACKAPCLRVVQFVGERLLKDSRRQDTVDKVADIMLSDYRIRCIAYIKGLIEIEAGGGTDKDKAVLKKEMRKKIIAMTE
ncbi:hypothetical protein JKP88DRAFT_248341 [Tribonema minus]|uniref:Uncharacterized protein n=1 Tax=Tribonema minus TaxID=303371 RepID=A0A835YVT7_9STRA|nr:hypothetical protein JKP88DRAFT_248341 [Tribonema minus]